MKESRWSVIAGAVVIIGLAAAVQQCEVGRSSAWRESQARQTEACAQSCPGGFTLINQGSSRVTCTCE